MVILGTPLGPALICLDMLEMVKFYGWTDTDSLLTLKKLIKIFAWIFIGLITLLALIILRFRVFYYSKRLESKRLKRKREKAQKSEKQGPKKKTFLQMFQISPTLFGVGTNKVSSTDSLPEIDKVGNNMEEALCVVCFDNPHNTVIDPCGHGGVCHVCIKDILT